MKARKITLALIHMEKFQSEKKSGTQFLKGMAGHGNDSEYRGSIK